MHQAPQPPSNWNKSQTVTEFSFLAPGSSLVLGLGATPLLTSGVNLFPARRRIRMDWIPLTWVTYVLVIQVQCSSACWRPMSVTEWTNWTLFGPLLVAGLILLAAALVLPSSQGDHPADLRLDFERDGKRVVAALAIRGVMAILANMFVMRASPSMGLIDGMIMAQIAAAWFFLLSGRRTLQVSATILYGLMLFLTLAVTCR